MVKKAPMLVVAMSFLFIVNAIIMDVTYAGVEPSPFIGEIYKQLSILETTPTQNVNPGDVVNFKTTLKYDRAWEEELLPGKEYKLYIKLEGGRWSSDWMKFTYPKMGQQVILRFRKRFTIPLDAKSGQIFKFQVWRSDPYGPVSRYRILKVIKVEQMKVPVKLKRSINTVPKVNKKVIK